MQTNGRPTAATGATISPTKLFGCFLLALLGLALASCGGNGGAGKAELGSSADLQSIGSDSARPAVPEATRVVPAQQASPGAVPGGLGRPGELARGASFVDADRFKTAAEFDNGLPSNNVTPSAPFLQFSPTNGTGSAAFDRCACAVYSYSLDGFSGDLSFKSFFLASPPAGTGYIGLANWDSDRWDWFALEPGTQQDFGPSAPYVRSADGALLACVLVVRQGATLGYLRVGANIAPTVSAIDITPGTTAVVDGTVTFSAVAGDLDGGVANYDWDVDGQPGYETLGGGEVQQFSYSAEGEYTPRVRVTDNDGAQSAEFTGAALTIIPAAGNDPPVAALQSSVPGGSAPLQVDFDASASTDPDGSIASYEWDWDGDGTYDENTGLTALNGHSYAVAGDFNATVRVTDNLGATDTASVLISVELDNGNLPTAQLSSAKWWEKPGIDMSFSAAASSDPDGTIDKFEWDWDGDSIYEEDTGTTATAVHQYASIGLRTVSVRVTDNDANTDTATLDVYVYSGGPYDEVENNDTFDAGNTLPALPALYFDGNVGPAGYDGDTQDWYKIVISEAGGLLAILRFEDDDCDVELQLFDTDGTTSLDSSASTTDIETVSASLDTPGTYFLQVRKFASAPADDMADYFLSVYFSTEPPVADLQADVTSGDIPLTVNFDASGSYVPDGGAVTKYDFDWDGDGNYEVTNDTDGIASHIYNSVGSFNPTVRAYSANDLTDTDSLTITTQDGQGNAPTADIQADVLSGPIAFTVNYNAAGSTAPNGGTIDNYEWDLDGNGVFETDTDAVATQTATYFKTGSYNAAVRVTTNLGISDTASISVSATGTMDEIEPNNVFSSGMALPMMPFSGFFCDLGPGGNDGGNEDWYTFTLAADATVTLTMNLHDNFGDLDMHLYASDGSTSEGSSTGIGNQEVITTALTAGTYCLKCYVFTSNTTNGPGRGGYELLGTSP